MVAIGKLGSAKAVEALIAQLKVNSTEVRNAAIKALGKLQNPKAVLPLIEVVENAESEGRFLAMEALAEIGDAVALPTLEHVQKYDRGKYYYGERVRDAATRAIAAIQDKNLDRTGSYN